MSAVKAETTSVSAQDCQPQDQQVFIEHLLCARPGGKSVGVRLEGAQVRLVVVIQH